MFYRVFFKNDLTALNSIGFSPLIDLQRRDDIFTVCVEIFFGFCSFVFSSCSSVLVLSFVCFFFGPISLFLRFSVAFSVVRRRRRFMDRAGVDFGPTTFLFAARRRGRSRVTRPPTLPSFFFTEFLLGFTRF